MESTLKHKFKTLLLKLVQLSMISLVVLEETVRITLSEMGYQNLPAFIFCFCINSYSICMNICASFFFF